MTKAQKHRNLARVKRQANRGLLYAALVVGGLGMCFPFIWMVLTSFKTYAEAIATPPTVFPAVWGPAVSLLPGFIAQYPLTLGAFIAWGVLGVLLFRRLENRTMASVLVALWVSAFFLAGNLPFLGEQRLAHLWRQYTIDHDAIIRPFFDNYALAWARAPFAVYFRNSIIISVVTPLLIILTSAPAAYAFARLEFPAKGLVFMVYLATMMVPGEVLLIPNFITIAQLGWRNTYWALIVPWMTSVMSIFFLRQFFRSVPNDLYDAAVIDGCGHSRFLLFIAMPLARPALVSTAMFNFLGSWNSLLWPLLVTDSERMRPIALGLASFSTEAGMQPQLYMAAATFTIVPILVLFLFVQKQFIEGIARSGIK